MADIVLTRVDSRLIHGQVASGWMNRGSVKKVIIIDDDIKANTFLQDVFRMVIPTNVILEAKSVEEAGISWQEDKFGEIGPAFILFKSVAAAHQAYKAGFTYAKLQIGGTGAGPGRKSIDGPIALDQTEAEYLAELAAAGVEVTFQQTISSRVRSWDSVRSKFKL